MCNSLGMEGVDKEKVQRVVYEMSKGSKYFQNEERKEALMKQKIEHMRHRCAKLSSSDLSTYHKVSATISEYSLLKSFIG